MDPDANLDEQLRLTKEIQEILDACAEEGGYPPSTEGKRALAQQAGRLAELVEALNNWIKGGGFLPATWNRGR